MKEGRSFWQTSLSGHKKVVLWAACMFEMTLVVYPGK
jgi:hypothetical protein